MNRIVKFWRLLHINWILMRHFRPKQAAAIRLTLETLGPIFVKFGQMLSTRRDVLSDEMANELAKLQDQVPPFAGKQAKAIIESALGQPIERVFQSFSETPLASASIAQVHAATLHSGEKVVVKVLRPKIKKIIRRDIALLYSVARWVERLWSQGYRLRPVELVAEFEYTLMNELDLMREAGNASQLRRNFKESDLLYIPKVYWDWVHQNVLVMERIHGIPISNIHELHAAHVDFKALAERGVEIFFRQVFEDNFFHADMHPGNIFVSPQSHQAPQYIAIDFGIVGSLSPTDQKYLAENLMAFFNRDYRKVALLHIDSGWVPEKTRVDQFEAAIRTVCEPIFERPLKDISFGLLLLRLFQTAKQFKMEVQPQLLLLQKTLLNIEGLGRQLYPELDLWASGKPFLERWIKQRSGLGALIRRFEDCGLEWLSDILKKWPL